MRTIEDISQRLKNLGMESAPEGRGYQNLSMEFGGGLLHYRAFASEYLSPLEKELFKIYPQYWILNYTSAVFKVRELSKLALLGTPTRESLLDRVYASAKELVSELEQGKRKRSVESYLKLILLVYMSDYNWKVIDLVLGINLEEQPIKWILVQAALAGWVFRSPSKEGSIGPNMPLHFYHQKQTTMKELVKDVLEEVVEHTKDVYESYNIHEPFIPSPEAKVQVAIKGIRGDVVKYGTSLKEREFSQDLFLSPSSRVIHGACRLDEKVLAVNFQRLLNEVLAQREIEKHLVSSYIFHLYKKVKHLPKSQAFIQAILIRGDLSVIDDDTLFEAWNQLNFTLTTDEKRGQEIKARLRRIQMKHGKGREFLRGVFG